MNSIRGLVGCALAVLLASPIPSSSAPQDRPQDRPQADPSRETTARAALELAPGKEVSLEYRTISWSAEGMKRMRQDPEIRSQMNGRFQIGFQTKFKLPSALFLNGRRLEPDTYRIGLAMNDAGAFDFTMLIDQETVRFPVDLSESRGIHFPYLAFTLTPAEDAWFALVFQWGSEIGRVTFTRAG